MANFLIKGTTILSLAMMLLLLLLHPQMAFSSDIYIDEDEEYVLDSPIPNAGRSRSRFLTSIIKKGTHCDRVKYNICNGVKANKGKSLLYCCKTHCRNVLGDRNNCGKCGHKCKLGERCCGGRCTKVLFNPNHCGKCERRCKGGVPCENGYCGYA